MRELSRLGIRVQDCRPCRARVHPPRSNWHEFVKRNQKKAKTKHGLRDLSRKWHSMSMAEKADFVPRCPVARRPPRVQDPQSVWPHCADRDYPISTATLADVPKRIRDLARRWDEVIGNKAMEPGANFTAEKRHLCEEKYGRKQCCTRVSEADAQACKAHLKQLKGWALARKPQQVKFDAPLKLLGLMYIGPSVIPDGIDSPGFVVLLMYVETQPFVFVGCLEPSAYPAPGDVVHMR